MKGLRFALVITAIGTANLVCSPPSNAEADFEKVGSMVALGDSITTGFNAGGPFDQKKNSWSSGNNADQVVMSHFQRLGKLFGTSVTSVNAAKAGAHVHDLLAQVAQLPASQVPDYATVLIGANDLCEFPENWSERMDAIREDLDQVVTKLVARNSHIKILLSALPDMERLREVGLNNNCQATWNRWKICPALLGADTTPQKIQEFSARFATLHDAFADLSAKHSENVKYTEAVRNFDFAFDHLASLDCFHPSIQGQHKISELTWSDGWFSQP